VTIISSNSSSKAAKRIIPIKIVTYILAISKIKHAVQYDFNYMPEITCKCFRPESRSFTRYLPIPARKIPNATAI